MIMWRFIIDMFQTIKNELYYIISHGILHLFGYDHLTQEEYELMVKLQKESLKEIDVKIH